MSKYRKIETKFNDEETFREALTQVCDRRGAQFEEGSGLHLYGYEGDRRKETATFVIRRKYVENAANDLGFQVQGDGSIEVIISDFDNGLPRRQGRQIVNELKQTYAKLQVSKLAEARGLTVTETHEGGVVRLRLTGRVSSNQRQQIRIR